MEGSFTPAGVTQPYGRVHAVVVDGDSLVHVLYTAQQPDASLETFDGVLDTLQRKGA